MHSGLLRCDTGSLGFCFPTTTQLLVPENLNSQEPDLLFIFVPLLSTKNISITTSVIRLLWQFKVVSTVSLLTSVPRRLIRGFFSFKATHKLSSSCRERFVRSVVSRLQVIQANFKNIRLHSNQDNPLRR